MPLYEYRCTRCDHLFEVYHEVGGTPGPCPVCGGPARRGFTSVGVVLKGLGVPTTRYREAPSSGGGDKEGAERKRTGKKSPEKKTLEKIGPPGDSPPGAASK